MRGYAGVTVFLAERVLLVQEPWDVGPDQILWNLPSGRIEEGETPDVAASRELAEESGCQIAAASLELVSTVLVHHQGRLLSQSWNFTAITTSPEVCPADPDHRVIAARWCDREQAVAHVASLPYAPIREPALRFLDAGQRGMRWTFELVDPAAAVPAFVWAPPEPMAE